MPPYIFGIVGWSGAGKTTLIERLIPELARRGLKVGTLKHDCHGAAVDTPGKDSARHRAAGATATLLVAPGLWVLSRPDLEADATSLTALLGPVDLVLAEGFKGAPWPKLEVYAGSGPLACAGDPWLVAVAGPQPPQRCPVPWYHWDEVRQIANVVENARAIGVARVVPARARQAGAGAPPAAPSTP